MNDLVPKKDSKFKPGQSGNPKGRPKGTGKTQEIVQALEKELGKGATAKKIVNVFSKVVDQALEGCVVSQKMILDRFAPVKHFEDNKSKTPVVNITINGTETTIIGEENEER